MNRIVLAMAALAIGLSGCATPARYVEKNGDGGVVAIPSNTDSWPTYYHSEAVDLIRKHVGSNFEIVEEREVPVGKTTLNNEQVNNDKLFNKQVINNTITTSDVTEWRIAYRKKTAMTAGNGLAGSPMNRTPPVGSAVAGAGAPPAGGAQPAGSTQPVGGVHPASSTVTPAVGPLSPVGQSTNIVPPVGPISPVGGPSGVYGSAGAFVGQMR